MPNSHTTVVGESGTILVGKAADRPPSKAVNGAPEAEGNRETAVAQLSIKGWGLCADADRQHVKRLTDNRYRPQTRRPLSTSVWQTAHTVSTLWLCTQQVLPGHRTGVSVNAAPCYLHARTLQSGGETDLNCGCRHAMAPYVFGSMHVGASQVLAGLHQFVYI